MLPSRFRLERFLTKVCGCWHALSAPFTLHGIGRTIHEQPHVPNYLDRSATLVLTEGMVIAVEPIIAAGSGQVFVDKDGWTVRTVDGKPSAHYEHTLVITKGRPLLVTSA